MIYPIDSYIGDYHIDEEICDQIVDFFDKNIHLQYPGNCGHRGNDGQLQSSPETKFKKSTDLALSSRFVFHPFNSYYIQLQKCLDEYVNTYPILKTVERYSILDSVTIQKYEPGEGFFATHIENNGSPEGATRCLVFMTYLNDVPNGGTEFTFHNIKTEAKKGNTLIWPAYFTHPHRGIVSHTHRKYIITGWYDFINIYNK